MTPPTDQHGCHYYKQSQ